MWAIWCTQSNWSGSKKQAALSQECVVQQKDQWEQEKILKSIWEKLRRNPARRANKLVKEAYASPSTMQRLLKSDLKVKPYKITKRHSFSPKKRFERANILLKNSWMTRSKLSSVLTKRFSPFRRSTILKMIGFGRKTETEYLLKIEHRSRGENQHRLWCSSGQKSPLIFIEDGVKINQQVYLDMSKDSFALGWYSTRWWRCDTSAGRGHRSNSKISPSLVVRAFHVLLVKWALASVFVITLV